MPRVTRNAAHQAGIQIAPINFPAFNSQYPRRRRDIRVSTREGPAPPPGRPTEIWRITENRTNAGAPATPARISNTIHGWRTRAAPAGRAKLRRRARENMDERLARIQVDLAYGDILAPQAEDETKRVRALFSLETKYARDEFRNCRRYEDLDARVANTLYQEPPPRFMDDIESPPEDHDLGVEEPDTFVDFDTESIASSGDRSDGPGWDVADRAGPEIDDAEKEHDGNAYQRKIQEWRQRGETLRSDLPEGKLFPGEEPHSLDRSVPFWKHRMPVAQRLAKQTLQDYRDSFQELKIALRDENAIAIENAPKKNNWKVMPPMPWPSYNREYAALYEPLPRCAWVHIAHYQLFDADDPLRMMYNLALLIGASQHITPRLIPSQIVEDVLPDVQYERKRWKYYPAAGYVNEGAEHVDDVLQVRRMLTRQSVLWEFQYTGEGEDDADSEGELFDKFQTFKDTIDHEYAIWYDVSQPRFFGANDTANMTADDRKLRRRTIQVKRAFRRLREIVQTIPDPNGTWQDDDWDQAAADEDFFVSDRVDQETLRGPVPRPDLQTVLNRAGQATVPISEVPTQERQGQLDNDSRWYSQHVRPQAVREHHWATESRTVYNAIRLADFNQVRGTVGGMGGVPPVVLTEITDVNGCVYRHDPYE